MPGTPADVANNDQLAVAWGNQVRDQTVQRFSSTGARDAALPSPPRGTFCVTTDTDTLWQACGSPPLWTPPWNVAWGRVPAGSANQTGGNFVIGTAGPYDVPGMTVTITAVAGRRYRLSVAVNGQSGGGATQLYLILSDGSNAQLQIGTWSTWAAGQVFSMNPWVEIPPSAAGSRTYKVRGNCTANSVTLTPGATQPNTIMVEDIGT